MRWARNWGLGALAFVVAWGGFCGRGGATDRAASALERSFWVHASLTPLPQRGYWGTNFPVAVPPTEQEIENAVGMLTDGYAANRLYLFYHREFGIDEAERTYRFWKKHCPGSVELVPTLLLKMYDEKQTTVFSAAELRRLSHFFKKEIDADVLGIFDILPRRDQGESLTLLAEEYPRGLIRVGLSPEEKASRPFVAAVQDTWSGLCHGTTNADWGDVGFGAEALRRWVRARNGEDTPIVWNLIVVAWDYSTTERGGYPGYDDAAKNMPLPAGRNRLAAEEIRRAAAPGRFAGFSSDLTILQVNSHHPNHDGAEKSFYATLKRGEDYGGYYAVPFREIVSIYREMKTLKEPRS